MIHNKEAPHFCGKTISETFSSVSALTGAACFYSL